MLRTKKDGRTDRHTDRQTDNIAFNNMSHFMGGGSRHLFNTPADTKIMVKYV